MSQPDTSGPSRHLSLGLKEHPQRAALLGEVHARPFHPVASPLLVTHLAMLRTSDEDLAEEHRQVTDWCRREGVASPAPDVSHFLAELGPLRLRWERHAEFSTYTFLAEREAGDNGVTNAIDLAPRDRISRLPGELLAATHLSLMGASDPEQTRRRIRERFHEASLVGCVCVGGAASVWTDFRADRDGFTVLMVEDHHLNPHQAGRLLQRLLEVETYRMMALLAFPLARDITPRIADMERELGDLTEQLSACQDAEGERQLLEQLSRLASRVEQLMARTNFRFSAAKAYAAVMRRRIEFIREERIEGMQTPSEFMDRRMAPAMDTCESAYERLDRLSRRVSRAANLLRARVDVALEAQNRDLLSSMDRRARLQLRLQQTVEGLSVVILSYYTVSLVGYAAKAVQASGVPLPVDLIRGLAIPLVLLLVGGGVWRARRQVTREET